MITLEKENSVLPSLCESNLSLFWGGVIAETLARLGVQMVVTACGNRAMPLITSCALNKKLQTIPILDERSAAFFALGVAKRTHRPVALVCTSGTAAANFFPAIIEARMARAPLIVLTTDRPPELRECHAGQTIDQIKIYGDYPLFYKELAVPEANFDLFYYLRQTLAHAYERSLFPQSGPVHLNVPFRDPLYPSIDNAFKHFISEFDQEDFFSEVLSPQAISIADHRFEIPAALHRLNEVERGLILVGTINPKNPQAFSEAVGKLSAELGWPVLAEALSPVRNYTDLVPNLITRYDAILRNADVAEFLKPEQLIQIGDFPTSKVLRAWLKAVKPKTWVIESSMDNVDPLHGNTNFIREEFVDFVHNFKSTKNSQDKLSDYSNAWSSLENQANSIIETSLTHCNALFEGKAAWLLSKILPKETPVFISTSMPVRDAEYFWQKNDRRIQPFFNRGANGIDGLVSTGLGIAHENKPAVLLIGDLSFLHDVNGLLIKNHFKGSLTIILVNNNGGRIFQHLPIADCSDVFEKYVAMPQDIDFQKLADCHGLLYHCPSSWENFISLVSDLPSSGIRIIEIKTEGKFDVAFRKNLFQNLAEKITI